MIKDHYQEHNEGRAVRVYETHRTIGRRPLHIGGYTAWQRVFHIPFVHHIRWCICKAVPDVLRYSSAVWAAARVPHVPLHKRIKTYMTVVMRDTKHILK